MIDAEHAHPTIGEAQRQWQPYATQADDRDEPLRTHACLKRTWSASAARSRPSAREGASVRGVALDARQRVKAGLCGVASDLSRNRDPVKTRDLTLSLDTGRVPGGETADQGPDSLSELEREVRGGGTHQLAYILDRHPTAFT